MARRSSASSALSPQSRKQPRFVFPLIVQMDLGRSHGACEYPPRHALEMEDGRVFLSLFHA